MKAGEEPGNEAIYTFYTANIKYSIGCLSLCSVDNGSLISRLLPSFISIFVQYTL